MEMLVEPGCGNDKPSKVMFWVMLILSSLLMSRGAQKTSVGRIDFANEKPSKVVLWVRYRTPHVRGAQKILRICCTP